MWARRSWLCARVPHPSKPGRRMQEVRAYATTTAELVAMAVWPRQHRVQRVVVSIHGDYVRHEGA